MPMKPHQKILLVSALGVALAFFIVLKYGFRVRAMVPDISDGVFGTMAALTLFGIAFGFARLVLGRKLWQMETVIRSVPGPGAPNAGPPKPLDPQRAKAIQKLKDDAVRQSAVLKEQKRLRVAELLADPAKRKYAALVEKGQPWSDEQIAYHEDPNKTATCRRLRHIESAMRMAGIVPRLIVKPLLAPAPSMNIKADCCINELELKRRFPVPESVRYQEGYSPERYYQDNPWATLSCSLCGSSMELVHSEWPRKDTRWFPSKPG